MENTSEDKPAMDYESERIWNRIIRFHRKGIDNRKKFYQTQTMIILSAAAIPIVNVLELGSYELRIISSVLGALIIAAASIQQLKKYQENWILFRTTEEALRREYYLFKNNAGDYTSMETDEQKIKLVERVEALLLSQYGNFFGIHKEQPAGVGKPPKPAPKPSENKKSDASI